MVRAGGPKCAASRSRIPGPVCRGLALERVAGTRERGHRQWRFPSRGKRGTRMSAGPRAASPPGFKHCPELASAATSRDLKTAPRHRWFYFPHSYSYRLVNAILDHWQFPLEGTLVDNFAGSGTTLLAARERGMSALGFDLSPLAVTVTNAKVAGYRERPLERGLASILERRPLTYLLCPHAFRGPSHTPSSKRFSRCWRRYKT